MTLLTGLGRVRVVAGPRWSGSSSAISINSPTSILVTSLGGMGGSPDVMQRSVSLLVPLCDNPVPMSVMDTCCSAVGGGSIPTVTLWI